jgi:hypothetical protein
MKRGKSYNLYVDRCQVLKTKLSIYSKWVLGSI